MSLRPELFENFLKYINENYNIESFDQLKEIFLLESEKIFKHIYINMKVTVIHRNSGVKEEEYKFYDNFIKFPIIL